MIPAHTIEDLAVAGARPAFEETLHVGRPNVGNPGKLHAYIDEMLERNWLSNHGPLVDRFEHMLQEYLGVRHCILMCNGTVALEIAIRALGLSGQVIVPSLTFVASAHALQWQEITPVFADIDAHTCCLAPSSVEKRISSETTGIMGVHLYGNPCDTTSLQNVADRHDLRLLYDASHAFGEAQAGRMIGNNGDCEIFSFHATKFLNTCEGGAVATNDDDLAEKIRLMHNFGFAGMDRVIYLGINGKMTEICAAMGLANFECRDEILTRNATNYDAYLQGFAEVPGLDMYNFRGNGERNDQYVVIRVEESYPLSRDDLMAVLHAENVRVRRYFWPGCHRMEPYHSLFPDEGRHLPVTEQISEQLLVFPTGLAVNPETISQIMQLLKFVYENGLSVKDRLETERNAS